MPDGEEEVVGETTEGLQVELFHPETDRKPGDTNIQRFGFDIHPVVFPVAAVVIIAFIVATLGVGPETAGKIFLDVQNFFITNFGWYYILSVNVFIAAMVYFAISKYGKIRLGGVEADHEFSYFSWGAMLFSAGMGIGLMFWSVAEPMTHFMTGGGNFFAAKPQTGEAAQAALTVTFFHWGFHPWAIYGIVALGLGFFSFNRGLPLTFRSVFYPLLGDRIYGWWGHIIDLITVFATLFGLGTSLGLGAQQINAGLNAVFGLAQGTAAQVAIIAVITGIATLSVAAGLDRGVKRLSHINVYIMVLFLAFMFIVGPTLTILGGVVQTVGFYLQNFFEMSFYTETLMGDFAGLRQGGYEGWLGAWTVFYWSWWLAWSPFVGLFIARISRGKTVREMIVGVLLVPTAFSFLWLGTFGVSALYAQTQMGAGILAAFYDPYVPEKAMFAMLEAYPLTTLTSLVAMLLVTTFFVTSSDSGSLVVDHLTSGGKHDVPRTQRIFWAITEGAVAAVLLIGGGLNALQTASISTGIFFGVILTIMVYSVYVGLNTEYTILQSEEFRDRVSEIAESGDVEVDVSGGDIVTGVSDAESSD
ncbi:MAG: BCCT family transporter [Halobacteriales archaeon]